jgi:membrane-anchored glycerophosphoryl diester phosphodiesterase (GDPDase)
MSWENNQAGWPPNTETREWSGMDSISFAWKLVKTDGFALVIPLFLAQMLAVLPLIAIVSVQAVHAVTLMKEHRTPDPLDPFSLAMQAASIVLTWVAFGFINGGVYRFALAAARGEPRSFGDVFSGGRWFGASFTLMALGGLTSLPSTLIPLAMRVYGAPPALQLPVTLLLLIPGFFLSFGWSMTLPLIVDRGLGGVAAMKESWRITKGRRADIFLVMFVTFCVIFAGCCLCGLGAPIAMAIYPLAFSFIYLRLTGQPVAVTAPS